MDKSYSILIVPRQGTRIRRLVVSRRSIRVLTFTVLTLLGLSVWLLADYFWMKLEREEMKILRAQLKQEVATLSARLKEKLAAMDAKHRKEVTTLSAKHNEELKTMRDQLQVQREKLLALQDRAEATQQLLANWKGIRHKIQQSLPRKHRSSLTGQQIVGELETILAALQGELEGLIASIPSEWPAKGWVSSRFGRRRSPWTGKSQFHSGIDIANRRGTAVYSPGDAVVEFAGRNGSYGRTIVLKHGQGLTALYGHLSKIHVKKGDRVRKNQKIGNMGSTGQSTSSHLHYEIRVNGIPIDPRRHLLK